MKANPSVPVSGVFPAECLYYAAENGLDITPLLTMFGLPPEPLSLAANEIELDQLQPLMRELWQQFPVESLGLLAGLRIPPTAFGSFGHAFISSACLDTALDMMVRYWDLVGRGVSLALHKAPTRCTLTFRNECPTDAFLSRWMIEAGVATCWRALHSVLPEAAENIEIYLSFSPPEYEIATPTSMSEIHYDCAFSQISFPPALLESPFALYSPKGLQQSTEQCESLLRLRQPQIGAAQKIRSFLGVTAQGFPSLDAAATIMGTSTRTLRRRLAQEQTSYASLIQEARMLDAVQLLHNRALTIAEIAARLGYREEASFCRAFKRWTQTTPSRARQNLSAEPGTLVAPTEGGLR